MKNTPCDTDFTSPMSLERADAYRPGHIDQIYRYLMDPKCKSLV